MKSGQPQTFVRVCKIRAESEKIRKKTRFESEFVSEKPEPTSLFDKLSQVFSLKFKNIKIFDFLPENIDDNF